MTLNEFLKKTKLSAGQNWGSWRANDNHLPCFAHRFAVTNEVNTPTLIKEYIKHAIPATDNDVIVFSVTEEDKCWNVWKKFAKDFPRTFKVVEGGSIHGKYLCRMYIYTKPAQKRKFHASNISNFRAR